MSMKQPTTSSNKVDDEQDDIILLLETLISALLMALGRPVKLKTKLMTLEPAIRT